MRHARFTVLLAGAVFFLGASPSFAENTMQGVMMAEAQLKAGDYRGAVASFDRIIIQGAKGMGGGGWILRAYQGRASAKMAIADYDGAAADATYCLSNASAMFPADAGYALRGRAKALKGDRDGALADYEAAIASAQKGLADKARRAIAYAERATGKALLGDVDGAIVDFNMAIQSPLGALVAKYYVPFQNGWQSMKTGLEKYKAGDHSGAYSSFSQASASLNSFQFGGGYGVAADQIRNHLYPPQQQQQQMIAAVPPAQQPAQPYYQQPQTMTPQAAPAPIAVSPKEEISKYANTLASSVPKSAEPNPNIYAVILGVGAYKDLPPVKFAAYDAQRMRIYLKNTVGVPERNIDMFTDEDANLTTFKRLFERDLLRKVQGAEAVYFYYAGHGTPGADGTYLAPYDAEVDFPESLYPLVKVVQGLQALDAKKVVMLMDTCFSGKGERSLPASGRLLRLVSEEEGVFPQIDAKKTIYMSATTSKARSFDYNEKKSGLFTYFLTEGMGGAADANKDGLITAAELHAYVEDKILETVRMNPEKYGDDQRPTMWPEGGESSKAVIAKAKK